MAVSDEIGNINIYKIKYKNNNINISSIFNIRLYNYNINCMLYIPIQKILVTGTDNDKSLKLYVIIENRLILIQNIYDINFNLFNDSIIELNGNLLVGLNDGIRVYYFEKGGIIFSYNYKNEEFGKIFSIKSLGNNYFICGRSFGFCSIFLLREKSIRKINIFRNNNLRASDEPYSIRDDIYFITNICIGETSETDGYILVSSFDNSFKAYSYQYHDIPPD